MRRALALAPALTLILFSAASATITAINVTNNSSPDDFVGGETFQTRSSLSLGVVTSGNSAFFTHRMAFQNQNIADGGAAQVHKRNAVYQIDFTVEDPSSLGFELDVSSWLRGRSTISLTDGTSATATGASFFVEVDDSTDAPNTFSNLVSLFNSTNGVSLNGPGFESAIHENTVSASLGSFLGTTTFSFIFSTVPTPTTNVFFGNDNLGSGDVDYLSSNLFGHFVTFTATFAVPEPTSAAIVWGIALAATCCRRRRHIKLLSQA